MNPDEILELLLSKADEGWELLANTSMSSPEYKIILDNIMDTYATFQYMLSEIFEENVNYEDFDH